MDEDILPPAQQENDNSHGYVDNIGVADDGFANEQDIPF